MQILTKLYEKLLKKKIILIFLKSLFFRKNNNNTIEYTNIAYVTGTCFEKKLKKIRNVIKNHK